MLAASRNDCPPVWPTNISSLIQAKGRMRQSRGDVGGGEDGERRVAYGRAMKELLETDLYRYVKASTLARRTVVRSE